MNSEVHKKILIAMKTTLFVAFTYHVVRVAVRTWKYGGSTTSDGDGIYDGGAIAGIDAEVDDD